MVLDVGADDSGELDEDGKGEADTEVVSEASGELDSEGATDWSMMVKQVAHWNVVAPAGGDSSEVQPTQRTSGAELEADVSDEDMVAPAVAPAVGCEAII